MPFYFVVELGVARRLGELRQPGAVGVVPGASEAFCGGGVGEDGAGGAGGHHRSLRVSLGARWVSFGVVMTLCYFILLDMIRYTI